MKATAVILAAAAIQGAVADFWVSYLNRVEETGRDAITKAGIAFLNNPDISCADDPLGLEIWINVGDASGDHPGVRTVPGDNIGPPLYRAPLDIVEFNTLSQKPGHHTIYASRDYAMVDINNVVSGHCFLNRTFTYQMSCPAQSDETVHLLGSSMFFCQSDIQL
ncbi:hypothetical protein Hte_010175 [Hypoxylon texense]